MKNCEDQQKNQLKSKLEGINESGGVTHYKNLQKPLKDRLDWNPQDSYERGHLQEGHQGYL